MPRWAVVVVVAQCWQLAGMLEVSLLCIVEYGGVRVISTSGGQEFSPAAGRETSRVWVWEDHSLVPALPGDRCSQSDLI